MGILTLVFVLAAVTLVAWGVLQFPMPPEIKKMLTVVFVVIVGLVLLSFLAQLFGVSSFPALRL